MSLVVLALALSSAALAFGQGQQPLPLDPNDLEKMLDAIPGGRECFVTFVDQHMHIQECDCERESLKAWGFYSSSRWPWTPTPDTRARCCCFWDKFHCILKVLEEADCRPNIIQEVRQGIERMANVPGGYNITLGCDILSFGLNCLDYPYGAATCNRPSNLVFWLIFAAIVAALVCVAIGSYWWFCTEPTYSIHPTYALVPECQPGCCVAKNTTPVGLKYNASQELGSSGALTGQTKPGKSDEYVIDVKCGE